MPNPTRRKFERGKSTYRPEALVDFNKRILVELKASTELRHAPEQVLRAIETSLIHQIRKNGYAKTRRKCVLELTTQAQGEEYSHKVGIRIQDGKIDFIYYATAETLEPEVHEPL